MKYGTLCYLGVDEQVLMIKKHEREEDPNSGHYTIPGGKPEGDYEKSCFLNEDFEGIVKCIEREFEEETGLTALNPEFRGKIIFDNSERIFNKLSNPEDFLVYIFAAENYAGNLKRETHEGVPMWILKNEITNVRSHQGDAKIYEWIGDGRRFGRKFRGVIKHKGEELDEEGSFVEFFD